MLSMLSARLNLFGSVIQVYIVPPDDSFLSELGLPSGHVAESLLGLQASLLVGTSGGEVPVYEEEQRGKATAKAQLLARSKQRATGRPRRGSRSPRRSGWREGVFRTITTKKT